MGKNRIRRNALAAKIAFPYMSMTSLLAWRSTSWINYILVGDHLRSSLLLLVARFFPNPVAFLDILTPWGALIVGEAALSHVLQEPTICGVTLDIAVGNLYYEPFLDNLSRLLPLDTLLNSRVDRPSPAGFPFHRHVTRISEFRLVSGLFIAVYESSTPSACDVLSGYWTTALMNFVTAYTMGCAYPRLTFNKCALLTKNRSVAMDWSDRNVQGKLAVYGFDSQYYPNCWPLYARGVCSMTRPVLSVCGKSLHVCPFQGRYFGDSGSLVLFYGGSLVDLEGLRDLSVAPYGPMTAWRLPSTGSCEGNCVEEDTVLPPFTVSMLIQFMDDLPTSARSTEPLHASLHLGRDALTASRSVNHPPRRYSM